MLVPFSTKKDINVFSFGGLAGTRTMEKKKGL